MTEERDNGMAMSREKEIRERLRSALESVRLQLEETGGELA
jgi:hypothetical protein